MKSSGRGASHITTSISDREAKVKGRVRPSFERSMRSMTLSAFCITRRLREFSV